MFCDLSPGTAEVSQDEALRHGTHIALLVGLLLLVAACGNSTSEQSSESLAPSTTATSTTAAPTTTTTDPVAEEISTYFVGNSLTNGTLNHFKEDIRGFVVLVRQADYLIRPLGWHIKCGSSLLSIAENPDEVCVDPASDGGVFTEADLSPG